MKRKYLGIPLICIAISLAAFSGVSAVCVEKSYNPGDRFEMGELIRAKWEYEECLKREKAEKEKKAAEEQELREKAEKDAAGESKKDPKYPFLEDVRDANKKERRY